jgi:hypothetical protein
MRPHYWVALGKNGENGSQPGVQSTRASLHPPATDHLRTESELYHAIVMGVCNGSDILREFLRQRPVTLCQYVPALSISCSGKLVSLARGMVARSQPHPPLA